MANVYYSDARAKSAEKFLIGSERLSRMIECENLEEALKVLSEVNFGEGGIKTASDIDEAIFREEEKFISFVKETCPSGRLKSFLLLRNDFLNAEMLVKSKYLKIDFSGLLFPSGNFPREKMKDKIFSDDYGGFPDGMVKALLICDNDFVAGKATGESVNSAFFSGYFSDLNKIVKRDGILKGILEIQADCANIGMALRSRDYIAVKEKFVCGGKLKEKELRSLCEDNAENLSAKFSLSPYRELIEAAAESVTEGKPLTQFERLADGFALKKLKEKKYEIKGYYPYLIYCYYKTAELNDVRIVLTGIAGGVNAEEIRKRLRECYEG